MVKIGREKNRPNTLVSAASVRGRTLADKVCCLLVFKFIMALQNTPNITFRMPVVKTNHNIYQYFVIGQGLSN